MGDVRSCISRDGYLNIDAESRGYICLAGKPGDVEAEANAHLIAAAPEMKEALVNLVGLAEMRGPHLHEFVAALNVARAAIAKSEGR